MVTWATFRNQVRRSVLKSTAEDTWTNESLKDMMAWALQSFASHTACPSGVTYYGASGTNFQLPDNIYTPLHLTGLVYLSTSTSTEVIEPYYRNDDILSYDCWGDYISFSEELDGSSDLIIKYFAYWPEPVYDDDIIRVPNWAFSALSYLMGVYALTPVGVQSANISQWKDKSDSGNPEHNSLRAQQEHFIKLYEREISRHARQDRENYFKRLKDYA